MDRGRRSHWLLIVLTMMAVPGALVLETLLRWALFPPALEALRLELREALTWVGWVLVAVTFIASLFAPTVQRRMTARARRRIPEATRTPARLDRARTGAFLFSTTVPQIPAILATFATMLGASYAPAIGAAVVVSIAIGALGRMLLQPTE